MVASLFALTDAGAVVDYLGQDAGQEAVGDYLGADAHGRTRWHGRAAEAMGLRGEVDPAGFARLLDGRLPDRKVVGTVRNGVREHKPGWDLTLSAPKSVSVMALVADDPRLIEAHLRAIDATLGYVERHAAVTRVRRSDREVEPVATGNIAAASYLHTTARPTAEAPASPQLHNHNIVLNLTQRDDGKWRSIESHDLYRIQKNAGAVYHQELAAEARRLGYAVTVAPDGTFALDAVPQAVADAFSARSAEIEAALEARHRTRANASAAEKATLTLSTRHAKQEVKGAELVASWRATADALGFDEEARRRVVTQAEARTRARHLDARARALAADQAIAFAADKLSERASTFSAAVFEAEAAGAVRARATHRDIRAAIVRAEQAGALVARAAPRAATGMAGYATREAVTTERNMLLLEAGGRDRFAALHDPIAAASVVETAALTAERNGHAWTDGQRAATKGLLTSRAAVTGLQGAAGTAKTSTVLRTYAEAARAQGLEVRALAPTATAADVLARAIGAEPMTVAAALAHGTGGDEGGRGVVEIIDEASMLSARDAERLLARAHRAGTRLVLVGDVQQLGSVEAGRAFGQLQEAGMPTLVLDQIVRQTNLDTRAAVEALLDGDGAQALQRLDAGGGAVVEHAEVDLRHALIARQFVQLTPEQRAATLVLDPTREGRRQLTESIRAALLRERQLGDTAVTAAVLEARGLTRAEAARAMSYAPGDVVTFRRRSQRHGIATGTAYTVAEVDEDTVRLVGSKGKPITWQPARWGSAQAEAFAEVNQEFRAGDRLQFSRNNRKEGRLNGMVATVTAVDPERAGITVAMPDGTAQALDLRRLADRHVRPGWVQTIHASQGATADRVLAHLESFRANTVDARSAYVAVSRARTHATIFTDSRTRLADAIGLRDGAQIAALDGGLEAGFSL